MLNLFHIWMKSFQIDISRVRSSRSHRRVVPFAAMCEVLDSREMLSASAVSGDVSTSQLAAKSASPLALAAGSVQHVGGSPFAPPEERQQIVVVDQGPKLDTGPIYRSGGPIIVDIPVDRYFGDIGKLQAHQLIGQTFELQMPAFDVDFDGSGRTDVAPERDRVTFNGHVVPGEFLTGSDNIWKLNTFEIPIEWANYPTDPGVGGILTPAHNTLQIDIDTANTTEEWVTQIDWVSLKWNVPDPVFLVHGILSNGNVWNEVWTKNLGDDGVPVHAISFQSPFALGSIEADADEISAEIVQLKQRWGLKSVNFVTHSKGGLDSREFVESLKNNPDDAKLVDNLVQIGTPNLGSPIADELRGIMVGASKIPGWTGAIAKAATYLADLIAPAGKQLTTPYMLAYNLTHGSNPNVHYYSLAGDYDPSLQIDPVGWVLGNILLPFVKDDAIVPEYSVYALPYATHLSPYVSGDVNTQARHFATPSSGITHAEANSPGIFSEIAPILFAPSTSGSTAQASPSFAARGLVAAVTSPIDTPRSQSTADLVGLNETATEFVRLDGVGEAIISMIYGGGQLDMTLISPSGLVINPGIAATDSNIDFVGGGPAGDLGVEGYHFTNAEPGVWTVQVHGTRIDNPTGKEPFFVAGWMPGNPLTMQVQTSQSHIDVGESILLTASLTNGTSPIVGASVDAQLQAPDGSLTALSLNDSGVNGDAVAGDGVYSFNISGLTNAGMYTALVTANGSSALPFSREQSTGFTVAERNVSLTGSTSDQGIDTNGNQLFDQLQVTTSATVSKPGTYLFQGELHAADGTLIGTASAQESLQTGTNSVTLNFDGRQIYQSHEDGPYTLSVMRTAQELDETPLIIDELQNFYTTSNYRATQFEHDLIAVTGLANDHGVDTDGNKLFDSLHVELQTTVVAAGFYQWSARLEDASGNELGFSGGSGNLAAGSNNLPLEFDGSQIGKSGVNGPYFVTSILINSGSTGVSIPGRFPTNPYLATQFEGAATLLPPVLAGIETTGASYTENAPGVPVTATILVTDPDSMSLASATIQIVSNYQIGSDKLDFANTAKISGDWDASTAILTLTGVDTVSNYRKALQSVQFRNLSDNPTTLKRTIQFQVSDGGAASNFVTRDVNVNAVNDPPLISNVEISPLVYPVNSPGLPITTSILVSDPDSSFLSSATVQITVNRQINDRLEFANTSKIQGSWNSTTQTLTLKGVDTVANYQAALRSVTYRNSNPNPSTLPRTIRFQTTDGSTPSKVADRQVSVVFAPQLSKLEVSSDLYVETSTGVFVTSTIQVTSADKGSISGATIQITDNYQSGADKLEFSNTAKITGVWNAATGSLTLSGVDTVKNYQSALRSVKFRNLSHDPSTLQRKVRFQVASGIAVSSIVARNITVLAIDDRPVLANVETDSLKYTRGNTAVSITSSLHIGDVDSPFLTSASIKIGGNLGKGDELLFTNTSKVTGKWNAVTGELILTGRDTVANYETAIRSIRFRNLSGAAIASSRTISFKVNDGFVNSNTVSRMIILN